MTLEYNESEGTFSIENAHTDLPAAVELMAEKEASMAEIEQMMDEEYGLADLREEIVALKAEISRFMSANHIAEAPVSNGSRWQLIRPQAGSWDAKKLEKLIGKALWRRVTKRVVDPNLIDQLVKAGEIDGKVIEKAYVTTARSPYIRNYGPRKSSSDDADDEETRLMEAMGN